MLRNLKYVTEQALLGKYAVGAFNVINLEFLEAIIEAARFKNSPLILNIAEVHLPYLNLNHLVVLVKEIAQQESIDIVLNLDHGRSIEIIQNCIELGFTSIMFDGSDLNLAENIRKTKQVVALCHSKAISVEAELGAVGGAEGGELIGIANPARFTDAGEAKLFVNETGIDALAVAIGNVHGKYQGPPKLDFARLEKIRRLTNIPLVLHGGSGLSKEDFRKAIQLGISKINFFTGMSQVALQTMREFLNHSGQKYNEYPELIAQVKKNVSKIVAEQLEIFGSAGRMASGSE